MTLARVFRRERMRQELSQRELARDVSTSNAHLARVELGRKGLGPSLLVRLADRLGLRLELHVYREGKKRPVWSGSLREAMRWGDEEAA